MLGVFALVLFVPILVQADVGNSFSGGSSGGDYGGGYSCGSGLGGIVFLGELALDGGLRAVTGILPLLI